MHPLLLTLAAVMAVGLGWVWITRDLLRQLVRGGRQARERLDALLVERQHQVAALGADDPAGRDSIEPLLRAAREAAALGRAPMDRRAPAEAALAAALTTHAQARGPAPHPEPLARLLVLGDEIDAAATDYNNYVRAFNARCRLLPSSLVANAFGFQPAPLFETPD